MRNKVRTAGEIGIKSLEFVMPAETTQEELEAKVKELSQDAVSYTHLDVYKRQHFWVQFHKLHL